MTGLEHDRFLDLKGLECPIPVVKAREEINRMAVGEILKVFATDHGSMRNFQGWAQAAKNILLVAQGFEGTDAEVFYTHYIRKVH
ncbi:MAG: sulfurtransferase TusA family protein [bacterium]